MTRTRDLAVQAAALCLAFGLVGCGSVSEPTRPSRTAALPVSPDPAPAPPSAPAQPSPIIARYDLQQIGGSQLPLTYSGGGGSWQITGGHYLLYANDTYVFGYEVDGVNRPVPVGNYVRVDETTVKFYLAAGTYPQSSFYQDRGGLFSTGRIQNGVMTVTYEDWVDFEVEKYVLSGN